MAYVRIYYHRDAGRIAPHVRYIAGRPGSCGLHGLGPAFRELRGDVDASVRLLRDHASRARTATGLGPRDGPFTRMFFTLPNDLAARVDHADLCLADGPRLVLRDALEATFRSAGRELQGVYAIHFHAAQREAHGHVHVDLSPLDARGRPTFFTAEQRRRLRETWTREVVQALARVERRAASDSRPAASRDETAADDAVDRRAHVPILDDERQGLSGADADALPRRRPFRSRRAPFVPFVPFVAGRLFGWSRSPLTDLFLRALVARSTRRLHRRQPLLAVRFALGLPVPRVTLRARSPLVPRQLLRVPFAS
jgi:hypothetical protein